jgi:alpha-L-fucosidase
MFLICLAGYAQTGIQTPKTKAAAADQHKEIGVETSSKAKYTSIINKDHWFSKAGLGMFIHFGLASLGGNHDLSWSMIRDTKYDKDQNNENKIKPTDYFNLARSFYPIDFCPNKWLKAAKTAGFEYAVLTTRHHDGFALWPSEYGDFSTKNYMNGHDLVKEYVDACRKNGIRVGFYYSPPDWYRGRLFRSWGYSTKGSKESPHLNVDWEPMEKLAQKPDDFNQKNIAYVNGQLRELLTRYGKIDYLWFDGGAGKEVLLFEEIKKLQPDIIINDRQHGYGDVMTRYFEGKFPKEKPDFVWEHCFIMNNSFGVWGYTKREVAQPNSVLLAHNPWFNHMSLLINREKYSENHS